MNVYRRMPHIWIYTYNATYINVIYKAFTFCRKQYDSRSSHCYQQVIQNMHKYVIHNNTVWNSNSKHVTYALVIFSIFAGKKLYISNLHITSSKDGIHLFQRSCTIHYQKLYSATSHTNLNASLISTYECF